MRNRTGSLNGFDSFNLDHTTSSFMLRSLLGVGAVALGLSAGFWGLHEHSPSSKSSALAELQASATVASAPSATSKPLGAVLVDVRGHARVATRTPVARAEQAEAAKITTQVSELTEPRSVPPVESQSAARVAGGVTTAENTEQSELLNDRAQILAPVPPRRPTQLKLSAETVSGQPFQSTAQKGRRIVATAPVQDNRSFFEKFFGGSQTQEQQKPAGQALAYAAPETGSLSRSIFSSGASNPAAHYDRYTAVYDISARTVYMPDGSRLEAHSGLGSRLDDPRFVHERMHGATPPHTYNLTMREALFHGVEAIRLNPIGNGNIFGRAGLLAHTYMLGPNGDSNGCVSFRNYDAFLRAFKNGEVKRLVVVARMD
jgi:hypothetical protein